MRILVTGPRGFVGARVMDELGRDAIPAPSLRAVDEESIRRMVDEAQPDLIIHTAAMSDIPTCENNPDGSYYANVKVPVWLARTGIKCVMFSTDQVYSGCAGEGPYAEEETTPSNLYSRHKLEMEQRTLDINPDTVHLRATWMYDMATSSSICCASQIFLFPPHSTAPLLTCGKCQAGSGRRAFFPAAPTITAARTPLPCSRPRSGSRPD